MSEIKIRTNRQWRPFVYRQDVPARVLESQFDWMKVTCEHCGQKHWPEEDYLDGFFRYQGHWYHLADFERTSGNDEFTGWHGQRGETFFSGVLIRLSDDGETFQVATYIA